MLFVIPSRFLLASVVLALSLSGILQESNAWWEGLGRGMLYNCINFHCWMVVIHNNGSDTLTLHVMIAQTAKPFKVTNPINTSQHEAASWSCSIAHIGAHTHAYKYEETRKAHNFVQLDMRSSEWGNTCCVTYAWDSLDRNRKIKHSKMLKLMHNLRCSSNFAKRALIPFAKIAIEGPVSQR